ncbi:outer membrane channel protein TolC [Candidatus Fukatsuia symbiotica]|uniref:Outer membrane protein TolC n=1 Tax=Candidatus Fukatsuia symbiotica TaxID=1878942 RepID=A0A2U8I6J9_9GAMM|nr:outer membrane channel protein TolC [Candidatus Fukatsuia symbiotica]AWK14689.1 outer membrane channel protein TolC [Candidatus Fukatsuia symbiotica]MEA9445013.1 outer membrane channel protein TolC [Candidatus Fukatsuia symbiotica]
MKKLLPLLIGLNLVGFSTLSQAENLLQVYQQARDSNPELRKVAAERDAAFEKINQASSSLLPQLGLSADYGYSRDFRNDSRRDVNIHRSDPNTHSTSGSLRLTQSIFDMSKWRARTLQEKTAGIQEVNYQISRQNLILNTATAYFDVLRAIDALSYTEAQKEAVYRQLDQTTQRFNVGLVAITDVQSARANYDGVLASEVNSRNKLDNALESLRQVTGVYYHELASLNLKRLQTKHPNKVDTLLQEAEKNNLALLVARLNQDLAQQQIKIAETGYMPTLDLVASTELSNNRIKDIYGGSNNTEAGKNKIGVSLNMPLYNGGSTYSQVKQAQYNFVGASEGLENAHRNVVQKVRSSFNNISASISSINAYRQAVISGKSSLDSMEAGYKVGTHTILDVLNATTTLYNAKQQLANARYDYLINELSIKSALGTLNQDDLMAFNSVLDTPISTSTTKLAPESPDATTDNRQVAPTDMTPPANTQPRNSGNPFRG